ncbi:MAG: aminotransferase class V-fold PLP-dependent enzyme [Lachnospiraceae bacterium]|nr:aminotransferase class V-fold PLP-dependent enzyme [Lachnospiraceae bacterium]
MKAGLYFDNAATTYPKPEEVYRAMDETARTMGVNAGRGGYGAARQASRLIEDTRELVLQMVRAQSGAQVVFTASATLAMNLVIGGIEWKDSDVVYVSPFEHNAVARTLHAYQEQYGFTILELPICEERLQLDLTQILYAFTKNPPDYVFMSHVSNVTGYILEIKEVSGMAHDKGAKVIVDASQSCGLLPIDIRNGMMDVVVFAGHKTMYGPFGIGGYVNNTGLSLQPLLYGGTGTDSLNLNMPPGISGLEPGSPNIIALAGLRAGLTYLKEHSEIEKREWELTQYLVSCMERVPYVRLYLPSDRGRHISMAAFNIEGYKSDEVGMILDQDYGIAVRTGYHCAPFIHKYLKDKESLGVVRASIGCFTTKEDVDVLVGAVKEIAEEG